MQRGVAPAITAPACRRQRSPPIRTVAPAGTWLSSAQRAGSTSRSGRRARTGRSRSGAGWPAGQVSVLVVCARVLGWHHVARAGCRPPPLHTRLALRCLADRAPALSGCLSHPPTSIPPRAHPLLARSYPPSSILPPAGEWLELEFDSASGFEDLGGGNETAAQVGSRAPQPARRVQPPEGMVAPLTPLPPCRPAPRSSSEPCPRPVDHTAPQYPKSLPARCPCRTSSRTAIWVPHSCSAWPAASARPRPWTAPGRRRCRCSRSCSSR